MIVAGVSVDMVDQDRYTELGGCTPEAESANGEKLPAVGEKRRFELTPKPGPVRTRHTRILGRYIGPVTSVLTEFTAGAGSLQSIRKISSLPLCYVAAARAGL